VRKERAPLVLAGVAALLVAIWGGLVRIGWFGFSSTGMRLASAHGPLMIVGFLGTVIGLERAVASKRVWAFAVPVLAPASAVVTLALPVSRIGPLLGLAAALVLVAVVVDALRRSPTLHVALELVGAGCFVVGQALLARDRFVAPTVPWWLGFLLLTIFAERIEAARVLRPSRIGRALAVLAPALFALGLLVGLQDEVVGARVRGPALIGMAVWIAVFDVPRRTIRTAGLPRFVAISLLCAATWLAAAGLLRIISGWAQGGPLYDANLHLVFVGAVIGMVFAHAPLIFPAILGARIPMRRRFYVHVVVLHAGLVARIVGDITGSAPVHEWGGMANAIALVTFLVSTGVAAVEGRARPER
jgi:hypothetical protein